MKNTILSISILFGLNAHSQVGIPTTTVIGSMKITDSLSVTNDIKTTGDLKATGDITATGEVIAKDTMRAQKDLKVDGSVFVGDKLNVGGQSTFEQDAMFKKNILFEGGNEFSFNPATPSMRATFYLGNTALKPLPFIHCPNPNTNTLPQFINNGSFISRVPLGSGAGSTNSSLSFYSAPWGGSGVIEVEGQDDTGNDGNRLLINYFCGRSTFINTNFGLISSGTVGLGRIVEVGPAMSNPLTTLNINAENKDGIRVQSISAKKAFVLTTNNNWSENFIIYGDGKTRIGTQKPQAPHDNAMLGVDGKIACKSLFVLKPTSWADFVFKKNDLEKLENVESFILLNKHLPGIPSEEDVLKNGYDINEMDAKLLEKIETLYLHIIELEKEIKLLKTK